MKVLIVEDSFTTRLILQTLLAKHGDCHVAVNGKEAVEAFRLALEANQPYDLICMDVVMPEMDGHEAVKMIRALEKSCGVLPSGLVKIIMTTGLGDRLNVIMSAREQCDAYLVKPLDTSRLLNYLESFGLLK